MGYRRRCCRRNRPDRLPVARSEEEKKERKEMAGSDVTDGWEKGAAIDGSERTETSAEERSVWKGDRVSTITIKKGRN